MSESQIRNSRIQAKTAIVVALISLVGVAIPHAIKIFEKEKSVGDFSAEEIRAIAKRVVSENPDLKGNKGDLGPPGPKGDKGEPGISEWMDITHDKKPFNPECEYRWKLVKGPEVIKDYQDGYFYPTAVTFDFIISTWSGGNYQSIHRGNKNSSDGDVGKSEVKTFCRCE